LVTYVSTKEDAQLFIQILGIITQNKDIIDAINWVTYELNVKTYEEFKEKYPMGSNGFKKFNGYTAIFEMIGILVNRGLLSGELIYDAWGDLHWGKVESVVHGMREEWKMPRLNENFEVMAKEYPEWAERNPPKI
jgi:hypothetical protein